MRSLAHCQKFYLAHTFHIVDKDDSQHWWMDPWISECYGLERNWKWSCKNGCSTPIFFGSTHTRAMFQLGFEISVWFPLFSRELQAISGAIFSYGLWVVATPPLELYKKNCEILVVLCHRSNLTRWIEHSFVQNTADNALWRGFWTLQQKQLRKKLRSLPLATRHA